MIRRLALVAALLLAASPAHAGYTLDGTDDRIDIGTMGAFGGQLNDADGYSLSCWVSTTQASLASVIGTMTSGAQGTSPNNQEFQFGIQEGWTTDFASDANHVLLDFGDRNNNGPLYHKELGFTIQNTGLHHYLLTAILDGANGAGTNAGKAVHLYADGVDNTGWTEQFTLGTLALTNYVNTLAIGAERKNGGIWFNWTAGVFAGCRAYTVALTSQEDTDIFLMRGRDSVTRGLVRSWPLQGACVETMKGDTCTPQNGPTLTTVQELYGTRRR